MHKILVSACLLDQPVRYDAQPVPMHDPSWTRWRSEGRLVPICPEMAGGLPAPRAPAEIRGPGGGHAVWAGTTSVVDATGRDYSAAFRHGANLALQLAHAHRCRFAVLKANSPSCGSQQIYDGQFSGRRVPGAGVTATLLRAHGIQVFDETELDLLAQRLEAAERR